VKEVKDISQYNYHLPEGRIAKHPLPNREDAKLLLWNRGTISHHTFGEAPQLIPEDTLLVFNDTKVISARLIFHKSTGAQIEVFLLHPELPTRDIAESMTLNESTTWQCMVGNKKKWKEGDLTKKIGRHELSAYWHDRSSNLVTFCWTGDNTFADIVNQSGETPLPPYLRRKPIEEDTERYQTVYSRYDGAVAAPTAGLHFTKKILEHIQSRAIGLEYLTLHVSAGTFKPVEAEDFRDHDMHSEQIVIKKSSIERLLSHPDKIIAVGTTSLRILESLYWFAVKLMHNPDSSFSISKTYPYEMEAKLTYSEALEQVLDYFIRHGISEIHGETEIYIYPGYQIRSVSGLFTNFHLPKSTLLLLISSLVNGRWKEIYDEALRQDYRFLSYGDSSLLLR